MSQQKKTILTDLFSMTRRRRKGTEHRMRGSILRSWKDMTHAHSFSMLHASHPPQTILLLQCKHAAAPLIEGAAIQLSASIAHIAPFIFHAWQAH